MYNIVKKLLELPMTEQISCTMISGKVGAFTLGFLINFSAVTTHLYSTSGRTIIVDGRLQQITYLFVTAILLKQNSLVSILICTCKRKFDETFSFHIGTINNLIFTLHFVV